MKLTPIFSLVLCLIAGFTQGACASDDEGILKPHRSPIKIDEKLKPAAFYDQLKPYLVTHGENNPKLKQLDVDGIESLNTHLERLWPFRFCSGVDGASLLLTANETGLKLDRGFRSQWMALRVWMRAPENKGLREIRHFLPMFSFMLSWFPMILTNPSHAPADALSVIDLKHNLADSMDMWRWATEANLSTEVMTHPVANVLSQGTSIYLFLATVVAAKGHAMADRGKTTVADIHRRIQEEDKEYASNSWWSAGIYGGMLMGTAYWNWCTLLSTLTGNLLSMGSTSLSPKEIAEEIWKNKTNCYIETWFQNYIPCDTVLPLKYKADSLVFEYTTYVAQATAFSILPWMIPHFLNLLWFFLTVTRL